MAKAKKPKHIAIAGNIGAGKTTLTEMLSKHYKWIPNFEDVDHNPYLMDFYEDMPRWSSSSTAGCGNWWKSRKERKQ